MGLINSINHFANSINPFKGPTDWLTNNTLAKLPIVGKPLGQLADWGDSHPAQVGAAIGAAFGGEALLGAGGAGGAGGAAAGDLGAAGAGADGVGALGTTSGFGGVGADAGVTGFGGSGLGSLGTTSGFGGVGTDAGVSGLDGASIDPALAGDNIDAGGGWNPASGGSNSSFDYQGMARRMLSNQLKGQGSGGSQWQPMQQNPDAGGSSQQRMAVALMQPTGGGGPYLPASQAGNAALAAYLMPQTNAQQLYQPGATPTQRTNRNQDGTAPLGSYY